MTIIDEIIETLSKLDPDELTTAEKYLAWLKLRRQVNHYFYFRAHWIDQQKAHAGNAHWI